MENIRVCIEENADWLIKRNLRREDPQGWLKVAQETGKRQTSREGKAVWLGETHRTVEGFADPLRIVFEVIERTTKKGQCLLVPEIEINTYWTSLEDDPYQAILLYHDHGTCEQFHSELKSVCNISYLEPPETLCGGKEVIVPSVCGRQPVFLMREARLGGEFWPRRGLSIFNLSW